VNKNQMKGTAEDIAGKLQKGVGGATEEFENTIKPSRGADARRLPHRSSGAAR
jgi:hypothetical protein